jgi:hypothetical protein
MEKIILASSERFVYDTAEEDNLSQRLIGGSSHTRITRWWAANYIKT